MADEASRARTHREHHKKRLQNERGAVKLRARAKSQFRHLIGGSADAGGDRGSMAPILSQMVRHGLAVEPQI